MEENKEKKTLDADESIFRGKENYENNETEDFADFPDEGENKMPELEKDLVEMEENSSTAKKEPPKEEVAADGETSKETEKEVKEETKEEPNPEETKQDAQKEEISKWEEFDNNNSVVKKYIVYIAKEFIPKLDSLTTDERSAYINDAIQKKIDFEDIKKQKGRKFRLILHFIIMIAIFIAVMPFALLGANKAIMMTFENYKYSQDNFEKLYKQRFEKDRAYMRSLEYNKKRSRGSQASF